MMSNINSPYSPASPIYSPPDISASTQPSSLPAAHQQRQRLRPWLIDQINSGKIPGLVWLDREKMIFKIPWKHFGRPGFDEFNDAMLFRNWAIHTKKYQEGEVPDISTWKTRFRCALHKLPDIDELNDLNKTEGEDPYRVYQFKKKEIVSSSPYPPSTVSSPLNLPPQVKTEAVGSPYTPLSVNSPLSLPQHENPVVLSPMNSLPDIKRDYGTNSLQEQSYSQDDVDPVEFIDQGVDLPVIEDIDQEMDLGDNPLGHDPKMFSDPTIIVGVTQQGSMPTSSNLLSQLSPQQHPLREQQSQSFIHQQQMQQHLTSSVSSLLIKLYYGDREVGEKIVDNPRGLRIAFNPPPPLPADVVKDDTSEVVSHIFGPFQAEQIYFPPTQDSNTMTLLECLKRGLVLQERKGEILATRLCRAKVFYSNSISPTDPVKELPREHTTVIFDFANDFIPNLRKYMCGQGPRPTCERFFSFGQKWCPLVPLKNNLVYISVTHCLAQKQLMQIRQMDTPVLISDPNVLDCIAQQIEEISFTNSITQYEQNNMMGLNS